MVPSALMMKPEPWPRVGMPCCGPPRPRGMGNWRKKSGRSFGSISAPPALALPITLMFTTAAPCWAVIAAKSGTPAGIAAEAGAGEASAVSAVWAAAGVAAVPELAWV